VDILRCSQMQKELILSAIDAVDATKGPAIIVYSTCSISVLENEGVIDFALKRRHVKIVESGLEFGTPGLTRYRGKQFHPTMNLARRYYPHTHNIDGFFVCKLHKTQNGEKGTTKDDSEVEVGDGSVETSQAWITKGNPPKTGRNQKGAKANGSQNGKKVAPQGGKPHGQQRGNHSHNNNNQNKNNQNKGNKSNNHKSKNKPKK